MSRTTRYTAIAFTALLLTPPAPCHAAVTAVPKLFWGSDPIVPGETAMLYGDGIGPKVSVDGWRLDDETVTAPPAQTEPWSPPGAGKQLEVLQASNECGRRCCPGTGTRGCSRCG